MAAKKAIEFALKPLNSIFSAQNLAIFLAIMILAGLVMLYFWPYEYAYKKASPAAIALIKEGEWVSIEGTAKNVEVKESGVSIQVCQAEAKCVRVFSSASKEFSKSLIAIADGQRLSVKGEVAKLRGGTRYVIAHDVKIIETTN
jgi:hypothetical protein